MLPLNVFGRDRCFQRDESLRENEAEEIQERNTLCYECRLEGSKQIIVGCGHTVCKNCLHQKRLASSCCTVCREFSQLRIQQDEIVMYPEGEGVCEMHREDLKIFCDTNQTLLCVTCSKSEDHETHGHWPIAVAALLCRRYILKHWKLLQECMEYTEDLIMEEKEKTLAWAVESVGDEVIYWRMFDNESLAIQEHLLGTQEGTETAQHEELTVKQMDEECRELYQTLKEVEAAMEREVVEEKKKWEALITEQGRLVAEVIQKWEEKLQKPNIELLQDFAHGIFHSDYQRVYAQQFIEPFILKFDFSFYPVATQFLQYFQNLKSPDRSYFYSLSGDKKRCIMVRASSSGQRYAIYLTGCEEIETMIESWKKNDFVGQNQ